MFERCASPNYTLEYKLANVNIKKKKNTQRTIITLLNSVNRRY